jgi:hypothetical protein
MGEASPEADPIEAGEQGGVPFGLQAFLSPW